MTKKVKYLSLAGVIAVLCTAITMYYVFNPPKKKISYIPKDRISSREDKPFLLMVYESPLGEYSDFARFSISKDGKIVRHVIEFDDLLSVGFESIEKSQDNLKLSFTDCGRRLPEKNISISKLKDREILARGQFWYLQVIK